MKFSIYITCASLILLTACAKLDLNPLSSGSSETWNSNAEEIEMSLNGLYKDVFWPQDQDDWTDDMMYRDATNDITAATINGETSFVKTWWVNTYKVVARANTVVQSVNRAAAVLSATQINRYSAEARFVRACMYSRLLSHYGNIVYTEDMLDIDQALALKQSPASEVLPKIYADFDSAATYLPPTYTAAELKRPSKGAALAMKARIALQMGDHATAAKAAADCMALNVYSLHPSFANLFIAKTKNSVETVFGFPRSVQLKVVLGGIQDYVPRNAGGWGARNPTWDLFNSFICTDGLPIDESPLYNPRQPFLNRDPRCAMTIVPFSTSHLGYGYQPHPDTLQVWKDADGRKVENKDNRVVAIFASYNGMMMKKGVDGDWLLNSWTVESDKIIIRYADVLLMYAEAKIELNQIDQTVLDAINTVRARAYGVPLTSTTLYPTVTTTNQVQLRKVLRTERRMEFANESLRYMDIIRWKIAEKVLNTPNYGMLDPADLRTKVVNAGLWFFPHVAQVDDNGSVDLKPMYDAGLIKQLNIRRFDETRQYLWPIPTNEVLTSGLDQNDNY